MTMDESHDEETSTSASYGHNRSFTSPRKSGSNNSSFENSFDLGVSSSIMEQTEKNLAAISESMTGSFCHNPSFQNEEENTSKLNLNCNLGGMPDCSSFEYRNDANTNTTKSYKSLFSDTIVQNRLLDDFKYLLGNNVMPCCEEKTILAGCLNLSNVDDRVEIETPRIRNRAGESWRARAYRIRRLREEKMLMIRSTVTHTHSNQYQSHYEYGNGASMGFRRQLSMERAIGKSHSADVEMPSRTGYGMKSRVRKPFRAREDPSDALGRIIGDCIDPIAPKEEAVELEVVWKQEDLCYDSDPGEMSFRSLQKETSGSSASAETEKPGITRSKSLEDQLKEAKNAGGKRRNPHYISSFDKKKDHFLGENGSFDVHVSFEDSSESDDSQYSDDDSIDDSTCYSGSSMGRQWYGNSHNTPTLKQVRKNAQREDNGVAQHVQKALNQTWTLTWHPVKSSPSNAKSSNININSNEPKAQSPRCIRLWFERGNRIRGNNIVEPKLMWRDAYNPQLSSYRKLNDSITKKGPNQICLLSICRILEVDHYCLDRQKYPFAKKSCSFLIRTCEDEEFLFEAQSEKEREDIVYLWKLVVARLASQAVVGDGDKMVGEFFVPSSLGVP